MTPGLALHLEALYRGTAPDARLAADPVAFVHRYPDPTDAALAGVFASCLAFGRVAAFRPVVAGILDAADERGGPGQWVRGFDPHRDGPALHPLNYRWNRGEDWVLLAATLQRVLRDHSSLAAVFAARGGEDDIGPALGRGIATLRDAAVAAAPSCGLAAGSWAELPRRFRALLPSPASGSACKRWCMFLRWMVRPTDEGIDLGLWTSPSPAALVIPLDTHVLRIARLVGLTSRTDGSWRTARAVTAALRGIDPTDPVRFDFALAHVGISQRCTGRRDTTVCPQCALVSVCSSGALG